jgi:hypothetical protein
LLLALTMLVGALTTPAGAAARKSA